MPYRLLGAVGDRTLRIDLPSGPTLLGADSSCAVRLRDATVSKRHAMLESTPHGLMVRDLDSTNGTFCDGKRIDEAVAHGGTVLSFGRVLLRVESRQDSDLELAWRGSATSLPGLHESSGANPIFQPSDETIGVQPLDLALLELVPRLLRQVDDGATPLEVAQLAGASLFHSLPFERLAIDGGREERRLFLAERRSADSEHDSGEDAASSPPGADGGVAGTFERVGRSCRIAASLRPAGAQRTVAPLLDIVAAAIDLAGSERRPLWPSERDDEASRRDTADMLEAAPWPQPPTVVPSVERIYRQAEKIARGDVSVLIAGESGTGKEVLARFVHDASPRRSEAFVALNCAALPQDLLEAELFGVERGAATGVDARAGKFELADRGTLLLDEVGDMAMATQAKLLRVLQEQQIYRVGGTEPRPARVRVIAATNRDLRAMVESGDFRLDLYHRLAGWRVELPPLRERRGDIANLAIHFLEDETGRLGLSLAGMSRSALSRLEEHPWPGNIRQLRQEIARAVLFLERGDVLDAPALSDDLRHAAPAAPGGGTLAERLAAVERREIVKALDRSASVGAAAETLGIHRATLYRRMAALDIEAPS